MRAPTLTADSLAGRKRVGDLSGSAATTAPAGAGSIDILGAAEHNLKSIDVAIPLRRLVCITGVSGSGKSTLVQDVLYAALRKQKGKPTEAPGMHRAVLGRRTEVVMVDQAIGRTLAQPRGCVIRRHPPAICEEPLAKAWLSRYFQLQLGNGRCPTCGRNG